MSKRNIAFVKGVSAAMAAVVWLGMTVSVAAKELPDFTDLVEKYGPAVVNVSTKARLPAQRQLQLDESDPFYEFFRRFAPPEQQRQNPNSPRRAPRSRDSQPESPLRDLGQGSGFVISADGYIITNRHVVDRADEVTVTMTDKREFKAKVIGSDDRTDIAVLKIEAANLPKVNMGDSDKLKVGEWVLAIGSPFGFENTVTAGIVSAKSRDTNEPLTPFIQTDAAVNPGNSGGPLFNMKGEVVGVNSQIYSGTGGYLGISFAIPSNIAMDTATQLIKRGKVNRGRVGVTIGPIDKDLAESLGLPSSKGALVAGVEKDSPAEKAGIEAQDIILKINGKVMDSNADVVRTIASIAPGTKAVLNVWRKGVTKDLTVTVGEAPSDTKVTKAGDKKDKGKEATPNKIGLVVSDLDADDKKEFKVKQGVVVDDVDGAAERAGIRAGDLILALNTIDIKSAAQFNELVAKLETSKPVALLVKRDDVTRYVTLRVEGK
jgi:serine protease Do